MKVMANSALNVMKRIWSRDPLQKIKAKLDRFYEEHPPKKEVKEWVEEHRKKFEKEEKELTLRYMKAELQHLEEHNARY